MKRQPIIDPEPIGVTLADGTFLNASAGQAERDLWIWMADADDEKNDLTYLFGLFYDPAKTAEIKYHWALGKDEVYKGFDKLVLLQVEYDGRIRIRMRRE